MGTKYINDAISLKVDFTKGHCAYSYWNIYVGLGIIRLLIAGCVC